MALDTVGPLNRLVVILQGLSGMGQVFIGVPNAIGPQVAAYVTVAGQRPVDVAVGGQLKRDARYLVTLTYQVADAEADAETTLAALVDALLLALYAERKLTASAMYGLAVDLTLADAAEYEVMLAQEFRRYPIAVTVPQYHTVV